MVVKDNRRVAAGQMPGSLRTVTHIRSPTSLKRPQAASNAKCRAGQARALLALSDGKGRSGGYSASSSYHSCS